MIERKNLLALFVVAAPSFDSSGEYASMVDYYRDEDGEVLHYGVVAQLVRYVVRLRLEGEVGTVDRVFEMIEDMIREGDRYTRELAIVGFLEDLQNTNLHTAGSAPRISCDSYARGRSGGGRR